MPRSFDFSVPSPASVEQIHFAFAERDYWLARLKTLGGGLGQLDSLTVDSAGSVRVVLVTDLRHDGLPGPVAKFFPREWRVVQEETWGPACDGRVPGEISVVTHGAPGSGYGTVLLAPTRDGSRLQCAATVEFKVPLIGGQVESMVGRTLVKNASVLQRFTAEWIEEHA